MYLSKVSFIKHSHLRQVIYKVYYNFNKGYVDISFILLIRLQESKYKMDKNNIRLIQGDCITEMKNLIDENIKVDLILTDPPYGTVKGLNLDGWKNSTTEWDNIIPTDEMFNCCEKLLRVNGILILFSQEPYTSYLRQFKPMNLPFNYPYYWLKDHFANSLSCKKAPVSYIEDISVFRKKHDTDNAHPLRQYAQKLLTEMNVTYKDIERKLGHRKAEHFFYRIGSSQFSLCTEATYNELINNYHIDKYDCFRPYDELVEIDLKFKLKFKLKEGHKYKSNVLEYKKSYNHYHPTEKPVDLLEDIIYTYTDEDDLVLDFTMGSGSTGVACRNLNRGFIGIELDEDYYRIACERIYDNQSKLV